MNSTGGPQGVRVTNSRRIFWIFMKSRTREKLQVSRFHERDYVNSRTTINKYAEIYEFTKKFLNFHEFADDIHSFHESRTSPPELTHWSRLQICYHFSTRNIFVLIIHSFDTHELLI